MTTRSVVIIALIAIVGLLGAPLVSGAVVGVFDDDPAESTAESNGEPNASVSAHMQASAADTETTVESELFDAQYERADNDSQVAMIADRTGDLEDRLDALEAERETLREQDDDLHRGEYQSRMATLTVEIRSLEREIEHTERRANHHGVDVDGLEELRENAAELDGPDVAAMARGLGVDGAPGQGPPADRGGDGGSQGPPADRGQQAPFDDDGDGAVTDRQPDREEVDDPQADHADSDSTTASNESETPAQ
ncbi:hypothetical protein RBH26_06370 [Natronolimnohabitans sp. A-GB9]|uniref:hypothetical protein n=1 Tax=Natronolimnohabitans sp. A-GB9 TaxID=3069757 RepID=UPI0027B54E29|nr:hypothetical protein [Natronolimnohabitans sp. A-GB9]MDQ2050106.1 hypothetical protein [Natronolimnohabitans sp. A-GB9]